jgi:hypothetical protein
MEHKQRQQGGNANQKYPEQETRNPDQRDRDNRPGEANIDRGRFVVGARSARRRTPESQHNRGQSGLIAVAQ